MSLPVIVVGGGGHAKVLIDALCLQSIALLGVVDLKADIMVAKIKYLGVDEAVLKYQTNEVRLVNGVGSVNSTAQRRAIFQKFKNLGYEFLSVIHPAAHVASDVELGEGIQIMAGAVVQPGAKIGNNSIINTNASVDHDSTIGAHVHIAPGVTVCGGVVIGDGTHVGTGATVVQNIRLAQDSFVRAGSVVVRSAGSRLGKVGFSQGGRK